MYLHAVPSPPDNGAGGAASGPSRPRRYALVTARLVSALALLATGAIHIQQYYVADYRVIPTIGTLFLLNFIAGTVLGLYLLIPARVDSGRIRRVGDTVVALSGFGVAGTSLIALLVSEHTPLFGFMEHGYRLEIVVAIVAEAVASVALGGFLLLNHRAGGRPRRTRTHRPGPVAVTS